MSKAINNAYDFLFFIFVLNCNPNGNINGNIPRRDNETGIGFITPNCIKRNIRDFVEICKFGLPGYKIFTKNINYIYGEEPTDYVGIIDDIKRLDRNDPNLYNYIHDILCANFFDIRAFGAVIDTAKENMDYKSIKGPVTISMAKSILPIVIQKATLTRCTVTNESDLNNKLTDFGCRYSVTQGLYVCHGHISAPLAQKTGFTETDLEVLWEAITRQYQEIGSEARHDIYVPQLIIYKHRSMYGNFPANELFDKVKVELKNGITAPMSFNDYVITISDDVPDGVTCKVYK